MGHRGVEFGFRLTHDVSNWDRFVGVLVGLGASWVEAGCPDESERVQIELKLRNLAARWELRCSIHARYYGVNLAATEPEIWKAALACALEDLTFAKSVGASTLVVHPGQMDWYDFPPEGHPCGEEMWSTITRLRREHLRRFEEALGRLAEEAKAGGVRIAVENLYAPWELLRSPDEAHELLAVSAANGAVGLNLDIGHALVAGYSAAQFCRRVNGHIIHTHLHVNDGKFDCHWPLTTISEQAREAVRAVVALEPPPPLVLELPSRTVEAHADSLNLLKEVVSEAGSLG